MQTRRDFIKQSCAGCLGTSLMGLTLSQLTSCSPLPIYKAKLDAKSVSIPLTSFGESNLLIVRDMQVAYDILIVKKSDQDFNAIYMKCSHQENPVTATATGLFCSSHGSRFDLDGNVLKEPALAPLKKFNTQIVDVHLIVDLNS